MAQEKDSSLPVEVGSLENRLLLALRPFIEFTDITTIKSLICDVDDSAIHRALHSLVAKKLIIKAKHGCAVYLLSDDAHRLVGSGGALCRRRFMEASRLNQALLLT